MSPEVTVHVNRGAADSLEPSVDSVETRGSIGLRLVSHGSPAHVHCRLAGELERIADLETVNYYVESEGETFVPLAVDAERIDAPVSGELEVLTGYGSESVSIAITVEPAPGPVDVDESLAEPGGGRDPTSESTALDRLRETDGLEPATLAVAVLGSVAAAVGAVTAAAIGGLVATLGIAIVVLGIVVALGLLFR